MLVISIYYENDDVCISSCFDLSMNEKCIYDLIDENAPIDIMEQCFLVIPT